MKVIYDKTIDTLYIDIKKDKIERTIPVDDHVLVDVDKNNHVVALEIMSVSSYRRKLKTPDVLISSPAK